MKTAIILIGLVAFATGLLTEIVEDTKGAISEVGEGIKDGVHAITGGRTGAAELMHHLDQGLSAAHGTKEAVKYMAGLKGQEDQGRAGLIKETVHHIKKGAEHFGSGAHDAVKKFTGGRTGMMDQMGLKSSSSSESKEQARIGACSLCTIEKASDKVIGTYENIKDYISPSSKSRGFWNLGGLLGGESDEEEHGTKVTKKVESKIIAPKTRGLLDLLGGGSSSNEKNKFVKEVHNVAHDLHGNKLAEQSQKVELQKERLSRYRGLLDSKKPSDISQKIVNPNSRLFGFDTKPSEISQKIKTRSLGSDQQRPSKISQKIVNPNQRLFGFGSGSSEEGQKVLKDTKQVLDSQGRPIAVHDKLVETHRNRFLGFGESSSSEDPKKIVKEVEQIFNAYGKPVSTTSKIIQHKDRFLGFGSDEQKFVQKNQQLLDSYGRPIGAVTKFVEHNGRIFGLGDSDSESEPQQKVVKETHEILNDYGQKIGTLVKYHETMNKE